ncbi:MAG: tetratricopeptide repeat protein [Janthinobacterium lividum]
MDTPPPELPTGSLPPAESKPQVALSMDLADKPPPARALPKKMPGPKRDYAAEEEAGRRLTAAHIQLRRGLVSDAEAAVKALLADRPTDAGAHELLGDIQEGRGDSAAAFKSYQAALESEPGRSTAEAKIGKAVLRRAEVQRQETLGVAYAATDTSLVKRTEGERSGWLVVAGSAVCPGLGQIVQGQTVKGAVLVGIFLLGVVLLTQLHGSSGRSYFTPAFWIVSVALAGDWLYAVADAAASSRS